MVNFNNVDSEEFMANPEKYGAPTFQEFRKNPEKYLGRKDEKFALIDNGPNNVRHLLQKVKYEIEGHRCKSLEEVEKIASDYGIPINSLDYTAVILNQGGGKGDVLVKFITKEEKLRRDSW